eukprot:1186310-Prorocentrum_minimum.AAC.2
MVVGTIAPNIHTIAPNIHTAAPNIHTAAPNIHARVDGHVSAGRGAGMSSYRAEAAGVLAVATFLQTIDGWAGGEATARLDNMGVAQTIAKLGGMTPNEWARQEDRHIFVEIECRLEQWGGRFKVVWQEGHPERKKPDRSKWTVHEEASEQVDELAKHAMREVQPGGRVRPYPSG